MAMMLTVMVMGAKETSVDAAATVQEAEGGKSATRRRCGVGELAILSLLSHSLSR
jgi:hypothetical protein